MVTNHEKGGKEELLNQAAWYSNAQEEVNNDKIHNSRASTTTMYL